MDYRRYALWSIIKRRGMFRFNGEGIQQLKVFIEKLVPI